MSHVICPAEQKDGERMLEILESSPAKGSIELLYTRRPNAYLSYKKESDEAYVFVVKDDENIIATAAETVRRVYIGGSIRKAGYVCGLKKDVEYTGNVNWGRAFFKNLVKEDIDCYYCSVVGDNTVMQNVFEKKRTKTANLELLQEYTTYMLSPYFKFKLKGKGYTFKRAERSEEREIVEFLNSEGGKKDFFPHFESLEQYTDLALEDFYILRDGNGIAAAGALWNQSGYRQYIVKKYKGIMRFARCLNPILRLFGYIELPKENENIDFPMLSFFISKDDSEEYYKAFLSFINQEIKKKYKMFVIGATSGSVTNNIFKKLRSIHFDTKIYTIYFILGNGKSLDINKENIWLECGLL